MRKPITKNIMIVVRTEQWEHTAWLKVGRTLYTGTGYSERDAELNVLRQIVFGDKNHKPEVRL